MNSSAHRAPEPVYRTILVPLDGSHLADGALPTARALAARFGATIHTVTVAVSDFELQRIRAEAAHALGTDPDDPRIHVEVDTDVAGAVHRCASQLDSCLICLSTHGRGRVAGTVIGSTARDIIERGREPVVVAGPVVVHPDPEDETAIPTARSRPPRRLRRRDPRLRARAAGRRSLGPRARHEAHDRHRRRAVPAARAHRRAMATPPRTQRGRRRVRPPSRRTVGARRRRVSTPSSSTTRSARPPA